MRKIYLLLLTSFLITHIFAQTIDVNSQWAWMSGDSTTNQPGVYGTKGTPSPSNKPGSRYYSASWKDKDGNFWIFGGYGIDVNGNLGFLNDLWKYNLLTNEWTWVSGTSIGDNAGRFGIQGIPSVNNFPGSKMAPSYWTDLNGNFWLFGGYSPNGPRTWSDVWKYNPVTNEWTWVSGSSQFSVDPIYGTKGVPSVNNTPGGRGGTNMWTDNSGNFWLFGGESFNQFFYSEYHNDLWKYNPNSNEWTWVKGSNGVNDAGHYGTKEIPSINNNPPARTRSSSWVDFDNNLWLFGGGTNVGYNDLWRFNITTNEWTWMNGANIPNQPGVLGTKGIPSGNNTPRSTSGTIGCTLLNDELILFNDHVDNVWKYNTDTNEWVWIKGDLNNSNAVYGSKGIPSFKNSPGVKGGSVCWVDNTGNFWIFGGNRGRFTNDLWKLNISSCSLTGKLLREVWLNVPGDSVATIPYKTKAADSVGYVTSFEGPSNVGNNYGARYRGYICAPVTGLYTFWISSDDNSELWLSSDDNPDHKAKIAFVKGWTYPRIYNKYQSQKSATVHLMAGFSYYIEALHKEAYGNDNLSVQWQIPGGAIENPIPGMRIFPYSNSLPSVTIVQPMNGDKFISPTTVTITANTYDVDGKITKLEFYIGTTNVFTETTPPYTYQLAINTPGTYKLTAKAYDNDGGVSTSDTVTITATTCTATGTLRREVWKNITGLTTNEIPYNTVAPDTVEMVTNFSGPTNVGDNYGARYRGYICVPVSGGYRFRIASDDYSKLFLSTDENPDNKVQIAFIDGWTHAGEYNKYPSQSSAPQYLLAGHSYYIEALHKENQGNDNLSVDWLNLNNFTYENPIPGIRLSPYKNSPPVITITSPKNGTNYNPPANIMINAIASDSNGVVAKVEFYNGNTLLQTFTSSPYTFTLNNVPSGVYTLKAKAYDNDGDITTDSVVVHVGSCTAEGSLLREYWANVPGFKVTDIPLNRTPTSTGFVSSFKGPTNTADFYGARYSGYICVPQSGNYRFRIASDDYSQLFLSTDDNPGNKVLIAYVNGWTHEGEYNKYPSQSSTPIALRGGYRYYIEALHKENQGNDNLSVDWLNVDNFHYENPIPGFRLSPYTGSASLAFTKANDDAVSPGSQSDEFSITILPNPTGKGVVSLLIAGESSSVNNMILVIKNLQGSSVYNDSRTFEGNNITITIPIDNKFPTGMYIVQVLINEKIYIKRLVVE